VPTPTDGRGVHANHLMEAFWGFGQIMRQHLVPSVVGEYGLDFKDFITLVSISEGAQYPKFICERLSTNASDVSRTLETLSKRGFVKRELDSEDSRRVRVTLTDAGETVLATARGRIQELLEDAERVLPDEELQRFTQTLVHLQQRLKARIAQSGLNPPPGDHRGWYGDLGHARTDGRKDTS
jgi:DNA-binding MarR family transcriptional regulator